MGATLLEAVIAQTGSGHEDREDKNRVSTRSVRPRGGGGLEKRQADSAVGDRGQ